MHQENDHQNKTQNVTGAKPDQDITEQTKQNKTNQNHLLGIVKEHKVIEC